MPSIEMVGMIIVAGIVIFGLYGIYMFVEDKQAASQSDASETKHTTIHYHKPAPLHDADTILPNRE